MCDVIVLPSHSYYYAFSSTIAPLSFVLLYSPSAPRAHALCWLMSSLYPLLLFFELFSCDTWTVVVLLKSFFVTLCWHIFFSCSHVLTYSFIYFLPYLQKKSWKGLVDVYMYTTHVCRCNVHECKIVLQNFMLEEVNVCKCSVWHAEHVGARDRSGNAVVMDIQADICSKKH